MTGYGKRHCEYRAKKYVVELKSLNGKQIDITTKIPVNFKETELALRRLLKEELKRGKVELQIRVEDDGGDTVAKINNNLFVGYYNQMKTLADELDYDISNEQIFNTILKLPEILSVSIDEMEENEWNVIKEAVVGVVNDLNSFREQEGRALQKDISIHLNKISELLKDIDVFEENRIEKIRTRVKQNLNEFIHDLPVDKNRFEQEIIYYLEKLDITEEKVRLANHCNYFLEKLQSDNPVGKMLGFIGQEIGREINTIGSKANDSDIQKIVVSMKDELEKIKEQLMNVL